MSRATNNDGLQVNTFSIADGCQCANLAAFTTNYVLKRVEAQTKRPVFVTWIEHAVRAARPDADTVL